jgi:ribosomal protein S18 acetylase RimI-like enzyme
VIRSLEHASWVELAAAFEAAFADYAVPMAMPPDALERMQRRRGYDPAVSFGAYIDDRLVGFVLTCRDGDRVYNSGTGVAPAHRRGGVARALLDAVIASVGARPYVLEVLDDNAKAIAFYRSAGFVEARRLQCWSYAGPRVELAELAAAPDLPGDVVPSWQNSAASIARAIEPHAVIGDALGHAVVFPSNGDLPRLVVAPDARRRGRGTRLLAGASARARGPLRILNVDAAATDVAAFLAAAGCHTTVAQREMIRG